MRASPDVFFYVVLGAALSLGCGGEDATERAPLGAGRGGSSGTSAGRAGASSGSGARAGSGGFGQAGTSAAGAAGAAGAMSFGGTSAVGGGGQAGGVGGATTAGSGGAGAGANTAGTAGAAGTSNQTPPNDNQLADNLSLEGVALFQNIKVDIEAGGKAVALGARNGPIIAGRGGVVRAYVQPGPGSSPRLLWGRLTIVNGSESKTFDDQKTISAASSDAATSSLFQFEIPPGLLTPTTALRVSALDPAAPASTGGATNPARFPRDATSQALGAQALTKPLEITLVPFRYQTDGSGRLPDLSAPRVAEIRASLHAIYPVDGITLLVREPVAWTGALTADGNVDFQATLPKLQAARQADKASANVYYYGVIVPAESFGAYCGGSCKSGRANIIATPDDKFKLGRVGTGLGYWDDGSLGTMAHELGHLHGRLHAPCSGGEDIDPAFPAKDGGTEVWGYDERTKTFLDPAETTDLMGKCSNRWVSSYTNSGLFARLIALSK